MTGIAHASQHDIGDYDRDGYHLIRSLVPREVATGLLARMQADLSRQNIDITRLSQQNPLLERPAVEIYGYHYPQFGTFHWGLTRQIEQLTGKALLPSYCYFRIYRKGDICRVHGDRLACEHSVSLTLGYADDLDWPLEVARRPLERDPYQRADAAFRADEDAAAVSMEVGDAVLYRGVTHHHGRTQPNPNRWSAHLFLHWVDRDGPFASEAFDKQMAPSQVEFRI